MCHYFNNNKENEREPIGPLARIHGFLKIKIEHKFYCQDLVDDGLLRVSSPY